MSLGPNIYVGPQKATGPVLELGPHFRPVLELGRRQPAVEAPAKKTRAGEDLGRIIG